MTATNTTNETPNVTIGCAPTVWVGGTPRVWTACLGCYNAGALVGDWFDAIDAFWRASILKEYFGKPFVDTYCTVKEVEADRFYAEPTLRDFEWYLRAV